LNSLPGLSTGSRSENIGIYLLLVYLFVFLYIFPYFSDHIFSILLFVPRLPPLFHPDGHYYAGMERSDPEFPVLYLIIIGLGCATLLLSTGNHPYIFMIKSGSFDTVIRQLAFSRLGYSLLRRDG
jgi:hypothetical protein